MVLRNLLKCVLITKLCLTQIGLFAQEQPNAQRKTDAKMKIEIWSDVICPWCYIGKRRFEQALKEFPHTKDIEIEWKSYQLAPNTKTDTSLNIHEFLAKEKGIEIAKAKQMNEHVTKLASGVGLNYRFDKAIPVNTLNAHCFIHFAKAQGKQNEAKEQILNAYFIEGKNIDDYSTLITLGNEIGLNTNSLLKALKENIYVNDVTSDIAEGYELGLRGVPFFVFNRQYVVSGAQESKTFLKTLEKSFDDWQKTNTNNTKLH